MSFTLITFNTFVCVFREKVRDIEELRRAVKQEAGELEMQLNELAYHYDDSLKMVTLAHSSLSGGRPVPMFEKKLNAISTLTDCSCKFD